MNQPNPVPNNSTPIADLVIQDIEARKAKGLETYKVALQAFNQRNPIQDAYEEELDKICYMKQWLEERKELIQFIHQVNLRGESPLGQEAFDMLSKLGEL